VSGSLHSPVHHIAPGPPARRVKPPKNTRSIVKIFTFGIIFFLLGKEFHFGMDTLTDAVLSTIPLSILSFTRLEKLSMPKVTGV
jgi:hypothetical protein